MEHFAKLSVAVKIYTQKYSELTLRYAWNAVIDQNTMYTSPCHVVAGVECQFRIVSNPIVIQNSRICINLIYVRFNKKQSDNDDFNYTLNVTIPEFKIQDKRLTDDSGTWILLHEHSGNGKSFFAATLKVDLVSKVQSLACLHDEEDLADFELRGEDGAVRVHRAVLAAASPVLRRMLGGTWKETTEGHVEVPGTSKSTLQHLKDFIYLHTLPETGLEQLVLLTSYYMMPDLEIKCINKMLNNIKASNTLDMLEYASNNKLSRLNLAILEIIQNGSVAVSDIRKYMMTNTASRDEGETKKGE